MAYCSQCGAEYIDTVSECSDCLIPLIRSRFKSDESITCLLCGTENPEEAKYCYDCGGFLQAVDLEGIPLALQGETIECYSCYSSTPLGTDYCITCGYIMSGSHACAEHPEKKTRHVCLVCKKPICKRCTTRIYDKPVCYEHADYHFVGNWAAVHSADIESELEPVQGALESNNIYVVTGSSGARERGVMQSLFVASIDPLARGRFNLLVPIVQLQEAEKILVEAGFVNEHMCDHCGHEFNGDTIRCPQCGEEFI